MEHAVKAVESIPWILGQIIALCTVLSFFAGMCWWIFLTFARNATVDKQFSKVDEQFKAFEADCDEKFDKAEKYNHDKIRDVREDICSVSARLDKTDEISRNLAVAVAGFKASAEENTNATRALTTRIDDLFNLIGRKPGPSDSQIKKAVQAERDSITELLRQAALNAGDGRNG